MHCSQHAPFILHPLFGPPSSSPSWQWYVFVWGGYNCSSCGTLMHCGEGLKWIKRWEECKEEVQSCSSTGPLRSGVKKPFRMAWAYKPTESPVLMCVCLYVIERYGMQFSNGCYCTSSVWGFDLWKRKLIKEIFQVLIERYFNGWFMTLVID